MNEMARAALPAACTRARRLECAVVVVALATGQSCGSDSGNGGLALPGGNNDHQIQLGKDSADFVIAYAHAYCDGLGPCCAQYSTSFDVTVCRAAATQAIADAALLAAGPNFEAPQLNSELIPHCLEVAAQVGVKCSSDPAVAPVNDACGQVFSPRESLASLASRRWEARPSAHRIPAALGRRAAAPTASVTRSCPSAWVSLASWIR
jgi:hypothetical protein